MRYQHETPWNYVLINEAPTRNLVKLRLDQWGTTTKTLWNYVLTNKAPPRNHVELRLDQWGTITKPRGITSWRMRHHHKNPLELRLDQWGTTTKPRGITSWQMRHHHEISHKDSRNYVLTIPKSCLTNPHKNFMHTNLMPTIYITNHPTNSHFPLQHDNISSPFSLIQYRWHHQSDITYIFTYFML